MFDFSNYLTKSKYYDNTNKLVVRKMKDKTAGVAIEEFVKLKPKMYSYLVNDNRERKKAKVVLLNKKCLRHSMNRIESKDHEIGTYEFNKISLSCFDDKIFIQNNGCDGLPELIIKKTVLLITIQKTVILTTI